MYTVYKDPRINLLLQWNGQLRSKIYHLLPKEMSGNETRTDFGLKKTFLIAVLSKNFFDLCAITIQHFVSKMYFELKVVDLNSAPLPILS